jgi:CPA2 family monovalent cation:H+ antiporter-2
MNKVQFLPTILLLLSAAVFVVPLCKRLHLSPVLGYFVAGAAIGSHGFGIISAEQTEAFAEFGVVFLLFAIGLELTFERLKAMRSHVFGFGTAQVVITSFVIGLLVYLFFGKFGKAAMIIGGGLAFSSTAIVLQVIAEHRRQSTQVGRLSLAVLLLQDFAVVPLLVLIPLLAGEKANIVNAIGMAFAKAVIALVGIFILGRLFLRPLFSMITSENSAKSNEIFVATTLFIALGAAWGTEHMGLSLALGAFVAGLLVAETEFQIQAEESIAPFKGLFLGLFFMTVGMSIDTSLIIKKLSLVALYSTLLILIKAVIIVALCLAFRFTLGTAIHAGLMLAQGSEFAFILFRLAVEKKIINQDLGQILLLVVTISMALTPLLSAIGNWIANKLDKKEKMPVGEIYKEIADLENHVIIAGFGRVGKMVARLLAAENIHFVAIDINADTVSQERDEGFPIYLGDASKVEILKSIGADRAKSIIISVDNEVTLKKIAKVVNINFSDLVVVVRSEDLSNAEELYESGATVVVPETYETGLQLGGAVLKSVGISEYEVSRIKNQFRAGNYVLAKNEFDEDTEEDEPEEDYLSYDIVNPPVVRPIEPMEKNDEKDENSSSKNYVNI